MHSTLLSFTVALAAAIPSVALSNTHAETPQHILAHHLTAAEAGDLEGVVGDYSETAVVITPDGVTEGRGAIRAMFAKVLPAPGSRPVLKPLRKLFAPGIAYLTWVQNEGRPDEVRGSDTFVVRGGKIIAQTVAIVPMHPPGG